MDGLSIYKEIASIAESGSEEVAKACLKGLEEVLANARSLVARTSQNLKIQVKTSAVLCVQEGLYPLT